MARERKTRRRKRADGAEPLGGRVEKITQPLMKMPIYEVSDAAAVDQIHETALDLLEEIGIDFIDDPAVEILKAHGVKMDGYTAYMDRGMVMEYVGKAPSEFTQIARNPKNNVHIGGNRLTFAPVYGPPFIYDIERGRREAKLEDFQNIVKLTYMMPYLHHSGGTVVEPMDEPNHTRHLDMIYSHMKYSDKPFMGSVTSANNAQDSVDMCEILFGADAIRENPAMVSLINVSSPRRYDDRMLGAMKVYAEARQAMIVTPFLISGAMAPVAVAGTCVQAHAETLAGIALTQMINPGCPVIYGTFNTSIDLQSGAPVFGSAEAAITLFMTTALARKVNLPVRSGGHFASSKAPDAQAAYESVMAMLPAVMGRVNFVLHAAGWLEGGLATGYEKLVLDHELLGFYHKLTKGLDMSENGLAADGLREVAPGGHHLGTQHTMRNFRTAFHKSDMFDYNTAEQWEEEGSRTIEQIAHDKWKQMLKDYEAPPLDPAIDEALRAFMTKRKTEIKPEY